MSSRHPEHHAAVAEPGLLRPPWWPLLGLIMIFAATVWPHIFLGTQHCEGDEKNCYYPTMRAMAADWPRVNPYEVDVPSMNAAGPLYLYLLSALPTPIVENLTVVKLVSSLLSLALLWVVYHYVAAACRNEWAAFTLTLPILTMLVHLFVQVV